MNAKMFHKKTEQALQLHGAEADAEIGKLKSFCDHNFEDLILQALEFSDPQETYSCLENILQFFPFRSKTDFPEKRERRLQISIFFSLWCWLTRHGSVPISEYQNMYSQGRAILKQAVQESVEPQQLPAYTAWAELAKSECQRFAKDPRYSDLLTDLDHILF